MEPGVTESVMIHYEHSIRSHARAALDSSCYDGVGDLFPPREGELRSVLDEVYCGQSRRYGCSSGRQRHCLIELNHVHFCFKPVY